MIVTFCGHGNAVITPEEHKKLVGILFDILCETSDTTFYLGDYGVFDIHCNKTLKELQKEFPLLKRVFVTPYLDEKYIKKRAGEYDETLYPFSEKVPPKFAIEKRNEYMIRCANLVIVYKKREWGGAANALAYAQKKRIRYINIAEQGE